MDASVTLTAAPSPLVAREIELEDLAPETAKWAVTVVGLLSAALAVLVVSLWNPIPDAAFWSLTTLVLTSIGGLVVLRFGSLATATLLSAGLGLVLLLAVHGGATLPLVAPWCSVIVLMAAALAGWRFGALVALVLTSALAVATTSDSNVYLETALGSGLLAWSNLFLYWLISRPTRTALDWALHSYRDARDLTTEARAHRAELAQLSKSLSEYAYRLEQLNLDLARARRTANEARKLKEQFAAAVSHELRTPLNLILGFLEMMVLAPTTAYGQSLPSSYRADLEAMYRNAMHISSLVDDILDLSQVDAGRMAFHPEWVALPDVVTEAISTVETLFTNRQLTLSSRVSQGLPDLFIDRTRVRQILINLLSNAARVVQRGGVTINAHCHGSAAVIEVRDTGPGIAPEDLPYIFEEFRQAAPMRDGHIGSGLGLTVSRRFAEMHGGTMHAESVVGEGSSFFLELPLAPTEATATDHGQGWDDRVAGRARGRAGRRIAVFDDDGKIGHVFQRHLDLYEVIDGGAFAESVSLGGDLPIHAVVHGTPGGAAQWEALIEQVPDLARLPVIACPLRTAQRTADQLGVWQCLVKPVSRAQLHVALRGLGRPVRSVLVVDDNAEMTRLLSRMIRSFDREVTVYTADGGGPALEIIRRERPDIVLLDLLMPGIDGYSVIDQVAADPTLRDLPVILVTAKGTHSETIIADHVTISRPDGLHVGELMLWIKMGLDALLGQPDNDSGLPTTHSG